MALGLIVNPVAGIGGRYALKGSDDRAGIERALAQGATRVSVARARRALAVLRGFVPDVDVLAPAGEMGELVALDVGHSVAVLTHRPATPTTAADTHAAARELVERCAELILFAGGDGTARDVVAAVGADVPVLGIPSGVKMRSAVFGTTPEAAGEAAGRYLANPSGFELVEREVVDAPDAALESELFGVAHVPSVPGRLQRGKAASRRVDDGPLAALCEELARTMEPGRLYLLGPGTTTGRIMRSLGLEPTLLGVDVVRDGALVELDADEGTLLRLLAAGVGATLILGVIGGQGFLLGRGNQQLSARVLERVGAENVVIVAGADKVAALDPPVLRVDLGDGSAEPALSGYRRVHVAPAESIVLRVVAQ